MTQPTKMQQLAANMSIEYDEDHDTINIMADGSFLATIDRDGMMLHPYCGTVLAPAGIPFNKIGRINVLQEDVE